MVSTLNIPVISFFVLIQDSNKVISMGDLFSIRDKNISNELSMRFGNSCLVVAKK